MSSTKMITPILTNDSTNQLVENKINYKKEGYFSYLLKNISNQFNKDPYRKKIHEQLIGSLIF